MPERSRSSLVGYGLATLAAVCWAFGGLMAKWLFTAPGATTASWPFPPLGISIDPMELSAGRALSAFLILGVYLAVTRRDTLVVPVSDLPFLMFFGVAGLAGVHFAYFKTISLTNVATAILLEYLAPVLVLAVSVAFMGHRLTWALPAGVALSVGGCALVVGATGGSGLLVTPSGVMWGLIAAVLFASYSLMGSAAAGRFSPYTTLVYGLGSAAVFWLLVLGPFRVLTLFSKPQIAASIVFMAVVSTIVPFGAFLAALRVIAPTNATVTSTIEPVVAGVGALLLFGERMTVVQVVGGVLVLCAIAVVQLPPAGLRPVLPPQD